MMDVFSSVGKQVQAAQTTATVESTKMTRPVETSFESAKTSQGQTEKSLEQIKQKLNETVDKLNSNMETLETNVKFGFNDEIDIMFVNVMEKSTGKTIRKIPTEEAMLLSEKMQEIVGTIFDKKG
jgi:flagellar protein FlaG